MTSIEVRLTGARTGTACIVEGEMHKAEGLGNGSIVYTHQLVPRDVAFTPALSSTLGVEMAVDAGFAGTAVGVHNGTDSTLWTASAIVGTKFTFNQDDEVANGGIVTIVTATDTAGDTVTIGVNGVDTVKTEGSDWNRTNGDNDATATSLATELSTISGVTAVAVSAVVTVTSDNSNITKIDTSDATAMPGTGQAIKVNKAQTNDIMEFDKGSTIDLSGYVAITMFIYVSSGWSPLSSDSVSIFGYDTSGATTIGNEVLLEDYFNELETGVWHKLSIPLGDLGLSAATIDALRVQIKARSGGGPLFYVDDMQVEQSGGTVAFDISPPKGRTLCINSQDLTFIDAIDTTLANGTVPNVSYDKLLGLTKLVNGILFQNITGGRVIFSASVRCVADSVRAGGSISSVTADATNAMLVLTTTFDEPLELNSARGDKIRILISDDLSGLISFTSMTRGFTIPTEVA